MNCPVCLGTTAEVFITIDNRKYWRCPRCEARFLGAEYLPSRREELAHYRHHENDVSDPGYRQFLHKAATPLLANLPQSQCGLDYGCGPGPALAHMLGEAGHEVRLYDPFFQPDKDALNQKYDFITCTETAEHFHSPAAEFARLDAMLKPGGWLVVMTCFHSDDAKFSSWHYRRDPTHVVFYREATFRWLANVYDWSCRFPVKDVALMQKILGSQAFDCQYNEI